jgi:hypothetical protein
LFAATNNLAARRKNRRISSLTSDCCDRIHWHHAPYPLFSPFSVDGGFYYAKASFTF